MSYNPNELRRGSPTKLDQTYKAVADTVDVILGLAVLAMGIVKVLFILYMLAALAG